MTPHQSINTRTMICFFGALKEQSDKRPYLFLLVNKTGEMDYRVFDKPYTINEVQQRLNTAQIPARAVMSLDLKQALLPQLSRSGRWFSKTDLWDNPKADPVDCIRRPTNQGNQETGLIASPTTPH